MKEESSKLPYGFYGRLKAEFPSQVLIDATEICNLACIHCPHPEFKKSEHYAGRSVDPELNKKLVDEVKLHGQGKTQYIRYTSNGEPLIHPQIFKMLKYAHDHSGVTVAITTNGKILNETRCEDLIATGIDVVDVSLDAFHPETYAKIRVQGDLNVTRANVLRLIKRSRERAPHLKVVVSYVEQPLNQSETDLFEKYWKDQGASYVVVRRLHSCSGAKQSLAEERRQRNESEGRRPCLYPWERIVLNAKGYLAFCPSDWVHGSDLADYRTTTIFEMWHGEFYRKLREAHLTNSFANHKFCGQCPDWKSTRWPNEGRSYASMIEEFQGSNEGNP
jgi:MoaA/NifB/PqqE/SkfB family radical SAM enzyme